MVSHRPRVTVLICTLNEEQNLPHVLPKIPPWVYEVILVDGHSTDNTVRVAKELYPDIHILYQPGKGKGNALKYGMMHTSGDIIVTLDADGASNPEEMPKLIEPLLKGYDFAKGSRFIKGSAKNKPFHRVLGNLIIALVFDLLFSKTYTDLCSGYNAFRKEAMERVNLQSPDDFEDEPLIMARVSKAGLKVIEVGHVDQGRISGYTKAPPWRQGFKAIKTIIRERFHG